MRNLVDKFDVRLQPTYLVGEASHYLRLPAATLRSWVRGQTYPVRGMRRRSAPVIILPDRGKTELSFVNLIEAHVLSALRKQHGLSLQNIRRAVSYLRKEFGSEHALAEYSFATDGVDLLMRRNESLLNLSKHGQAEMEKLIGAHLRRIERDPSGKAIRLYPFTYLQGLDQPKAIVIDPRVSFGRPVIAGTGIPTVVIAERYKAGESVGDLAADYDRSREEIEDAIRCELEAA